MHVTDLNIIFPTYFYHISVHLYINFPLQDEEEENTPEVLPEVDPLLHLVLKSDTIGMLMVGMLTAGPD